METLPWRNAAHTLAHEAAKRARNGRRDSLVTLTALRRLYVAPPAAWESAAKMLLGGAAGGRASAPKRKAVRLRFAAAKAKRLAMTPEPLWLKPER